MVQPCGRYVRRSCTTAWNHASTKSRFARARLPFSTYAAPHDESVRCRFFLRPGGDSNVALRHCWSSGRGNGGSSKGGQGGAGGSKGKGKGKSKGKEAAGSEHEGRAGRGALALEVLKAADLFQAEGLLKHCLEGFRGALTVHTVAEQLVWAHTRGPAAARAMATEYFVAHGRAVRKEAPRTMALIKALPSDVVTAILETVLD